MQTSNNNWKSGECIRLDGRCWQGSECMPVVTAAILDELVRLKNQTQT